MYFWFAASTVNLVIFTFGYKSFSELRQHPTSLTSNFLITGTLHTMTREQAKTEIKSRGGKFHSSITQNLDFVIAGDNPGSKYNKAKKLGIKILDEDEFLKMLK